MTIGWNPFVCGRYLAELFDIKVLVGSGSDEYLFGNPNSLDDDLRTI